MSQHFIAQIEEVSSASSSASEVAPINFQIPNYRMVHFHPDFETIGTLKISQFVELHKLSLEHFWKSDKYYFGYQDIKEMCENIGLRLGPDDEVDLKHQLFHTNLVISIYQFKDKIKSWKHYSAAKINDFLQKRISILNDSILKAKGGPANQKKIQRPLSSISYNRKQDGGYENKSIQYLKLQKVRAKQQENKLTQAINKAKNEQQYEVLIKMGEANDLNKEMESFLTYRAYKNAQGNLKVKVFNLDKFQKQINLQEFQREYNFIKKRYTQSKNLNIWDMLATKNKTPNQTRQSSHFSKKNIKTVEREKKKKKMVEILTETINLTNIFKEQLRILKSQGICKRNA